MLGWLAVAITVSGLLALSHEFVGEGFALGLASNILWIVAFPAAPEIIVVNALIGLANIYGLTRVLRRN